MKDDDIILCCALRYALGRKTYITSIVPQYIINKIDSIDTNTINTMIRDIESCENYGDECDKVYWMKLLEVLKNKIKGE